MPERELQAIEEHLALVAEVRARLDDVDACARRLIRLYEGDGRLYTLGNGGSAADAQHFAEELVGRFARDRRPLPAQSLASDSAALTCIANDYSFEEVFERQVRAFVRRDDVVAAFTTSGRSPNVVRALASARDAGATTVLFGGGDGGPAAQHADHAFVIPSSATARVQEMHVLLLHLLLERVDEWAARDQ